MSEPLRKTVLVRCSTQHAFAVFTRRVDVWWPPNHRRFERSTLVLQSRVGGRFFERASTGEEALLGEVLVYEPPHRLVYTWYPGAANLPTRVDVTFVQEGESTRIEVLHSEGESDLAQLWPERVKLFDRGWGHVLSALVRHLNRGAA